MFGISVECTSILGLKPYGRKIEAMISYRGNEFSRFLRPLPTPEPETQRSTNFAIFIGREIDSLQVIDVMTSNAGSTISGGFRN
jgi:hypothetical protein